MLKKAQDKIRMAFNRDENWPVVFARTFSTPHGKMALRYLQSYILDRHLPPTATPHELYYQEGRRSLVNHIQNLIDTGSGLNN